MRLGSRAYFDVPLGEPPRVAAAALARPHREGLIALTGGPTGPLDTRPAVGRPAGSRRSPPRHPQGGVRRASSTSRSSATGSTTSARRGASCIALADRNGLPLVADERAVLRQAPPTTRRMTRCSPSRRAALVSDERRRRAVAASMTSRRAQRDDGAVRATCRTRCSQRRDRHALLATGSRPASRSCRASAVGSGRRATRSTRAAELRRQAEEGLARRLAAHGTAPGLTEQDYRDRLAFEVGVIQRDEIPGLLPDRRPTSSNGPRTTTSRSGRAAARARARSSPMRSPITDLDPLRFGLLFERFLNPERVSMPDFDIDFCVEGRERVIEYVQKRYGEEQVGADHHLRNAAGPRRAARRRPRARNALRPGRQAHQAGAAEPGQSGHARAGHRGRAEAAGGHRRGAGRRAPARRSRRSSKACTATPRPTRPAS